MNTQFAKWPCLIVVVATLVSGCATKTEDVKVSPEERAQRLKQGYVYYLDGAGGGGTTNWLGGVRNGLLKAGYDGSGEMFSWETGKGVVADQESSNEYKKEKAAELASQIQAFRAEHGDVPITLIGFSAGTAVATFTLETLPEDVRISDVILLGGSLSTSHDLTNALKRIDNRLYIFTSRKDAVLQLAIPLSGAADRDATTTDTVGVDGPQVPEGASEETRELYADKVIVIPRTRKAEHYGDEGGHTDAVGEDFVRHYVAPLVNT
ncbi:MAG: alpha/beta fold hydrolase, partial [Planctomycetota bacterium]